jgi:regulator of replication initiation timing
MNFLKSLPRDFKIKALISFVVISSLCIFIGPNKSEEACVSKHCKEILEENKKLRAENDRLRKEINELQKMGEEDYKREREEQWWKYPEESFTN